MVKLSNKLKAEIDKVVDAGFTVKQTFITRINGKLHTALLTSTNSLSSNPMIDLGSFDNETEGLELTQQAFKYALRGSK
jgi:hypothetical protein